MAILTVRESREAPLTRPDEIHDFIEPYGLSYQRWDIDKLHDDASQKGADESESDRILRVFSDEIERLKREGGYATADVIALSPSTPNLDGLLAKFDKEHLHTEDEVRFVVDGRGVFTIHTPDHKVFDVEVHAGDLLVVPTDCWHWFTLCEDRTIKCIRVFESTDGWAPHYREASESAAQ